VNKHNILTETIKALEENAPVLEAEGYNGAAEDMRDLAAQLEGLLSSHLLEGEISPARPATLPARIVLRQTKPDEWATHMACLQESGVWSFTWGHYFNNLPAAAVDFGARCIQLKGGPLLMPTIEHAAELDNGLAPHFRRLLEVLR
jgi:hypothetical protein